MLLSAFLISTLAAPARADTVAPCDGQRVAAVEINTQRPAFEGTAGKWRAAAHALGLHHVTTREQVIESFSLVHRGDVCTERRLSETERVLRSLPFLADAAVRAEPADSGTVTVKIETTDEVPVLVAGGLRHSVPSALSLGNENLFGLGTSIMLGAARNTPFRSTAFGTGSAYGLLGQFTLATADVRRDVLGDHVEVGVSRLLLSDLQRVAFTSSFRAGDDFPIIVRSGDDQAVQIRDRRWSVGAIVRANLGTTPLLLGPVALGNSESPTATSVVLADSGVVPMPDTSLLARFRSYHATRVGALLGARRVRFVTRTGFDALFAPQDLMVGWQIGTIAAPGVTAGSHHDMLIAPSIYFGTASHRTALLADGEIETRRAFDSGAAASTIANVHAIGYAKPSDAVLFTIENNLSVLDGAVLPTQLVMSDPLGGPRGFSGSSLVGARRDVVRLEARVAAPALVRRADLGLALFADHGWLGAGQVPYGVSSSASSIGVSLLASYPTHAKRTYRLDIAIPTTGAHGRGVEVRFINGDPTSSFAVEPRDVTQARTAPVPSLLFTWPGR